MPGQSMESQELNTNTAVHQDYTEVAKNATKFGKTKAFRTQWNKLQSSTLKLQQEH